MSSEIFSGLALAIAATEASRPGGRVDDGVEVAVKMIQQTAANSDVPNVKGVKHALTVWGIEISGAGRSISQMFSSTPTFDCVLPEGWTISGEQGHSHLKDETGAARLHWYVHGWDPITVQVCDRYCIREKHLSPSMSALQVLDGVTSIHSVVVNYPVARNKACGDQFYLIHEEIEQEDYAKNSSASGAVGGDVRKWLDERVAGWNDYSKQAETWLLEISQAD